MSHRFDDQFRGSLHELLAARRDVRHFLRTPLADGTIERLVEMACLAPSVGYSQPWRWLQIRSAEKRAAILENFQSCNAQALRDYSGAQAALYARLKLAGLVEAPVHLAVFVDSGTSAGHGLGIQSMPEMLAYSAVCAIHTLWLAARAEGIGVGWVSILNPEQVRRSLDVPEQWQFIAYLCIGYPQEERERPELETEGWEQRQAATNCLLER